jgi:hypothetical protein
VVYCSYGRGQILRPSRAETTLPISTKFCANDNVGQIKKLINFVTIGCMVADLHVGEIYSSRLSFFTFLLLPNYLLVSSTRL